MAILAVHSTNGRATRDIVVPGRNPLRPFGGIRIANNVGQRQEGDWDAVKAALAAGNLVISLSAYETDVAPLYLQGKLHYGGNVRFDCAREPKWRLVTSDVDGYCSLEEHPHPCTVDGCTQGFDTPLALGRHVRNDHREVSADS